MLNIKTNKLSEQDLVAAVKNINRKNKEDIFALLKSVAESANWDIDMILTESIQLIRKSEGVLSAHDAQGLRNYFRTVLIAKKYGISDKFDICGRADYYVDGVTDNCIVIYSRVSKTSIILSSNGNLILDEGYVQLLTNSISCYGYTVYNNQEGWGVFSRKGKEILPCIFNKVDNKSSRGLHVVYKDVEFYCIVYDENCELTPWVGRERSSFVFDGGIVGLKPRWIDSLSHHSELGVPMYIDPSVFKEPMRIRRMRIQKYIDEISEEVYMKISSTHHRLTKEDLQKLKR